jgi:hypothetical protein
MDPGIGPGRSPDRGRLAEHDGQLLLEGSLDGGHTRLDLPPVVGGADVLEGQLEVPQNSLFCAEMLEK